MAAVAEGSQMEVSFDNNELVIDGKQAIISPAANKAAEGTGYRPAPGRFCYT